MSEAEKSKLKQEIILDAAVKEFAEKGYKAASTNAICKRAGVSKGLIFHYYKDKPTLFYECVKKGLDKYMLEADIDSTLSERDIFKRAELWSQEKERTLMSDKGLAAVVAEAYLLPEDEEYAAAKNLYKEVYNKLLEKFMYNLDYSKFRSDLDSKFIVEYIVKSIGGVGDILLKEYGSAEAVNDYDKLKEIVDGFIDMIKYGVYK